MKWLWIQVHILKRKEWWNKHHGAKFIVRRVDSGGVYGRYVGHAVDSCYRHGTFLNLFRRAKK